MEKYLVRVKWETKIRGRNDEMMLKQSSFFGIVVLLDLFYIYAIQVLEK